MPSGSWIHISVRPQGSAAGSRMTGTPAAASLVARHVRGDAGGADEIGTSVATLIE